MLARQEREFEYYEEELQPRPQRIEKAAPAPKRRPTLNTHLRSRCFLLLALICVMAMAVTIRSGITASRGYDLVKVQQQAEALEKENEHLRIEIAQMKSPERVRRIATEELGMSTPKTVYFATGTRE
ncbi:cell division protein FtsL [uncultured Selenomonas sp.]|uniref:cell division protein FtsL n=1 Tax=uncultured Selenomonas sp. TaxID=159275 RepID=UPI0028DB11A5|nr:cell division protein FtsL [uncultured Selenomonas sp.]